MEALSLLQGPDRELRRSRRRGRHRRAAARPAHARLHLQHAAPGQVDQGPAALLPALAGLAQPGQRGQRRVGHRRWSTPWSAATSWRGAGTGSRRGCSGSTSWPTTTAWRRWPRPSSTCPTTRPRPRCWTATARFSPELGDTAGELLRGQLHRRAAAAGQARRRVLRLHRALGAPVRAAQLHLAPRRRADDGPRARPRRARRAGAAAGHVRVHHAADGGRDRVDLRRDDRARAAARARRPTPPRGCRCWPSRSTARSPRCSARSR